VAGVYAPRSPASGVLTGVGRAHVADFLCKEGDDSRAECRQQKRGAKQDARDSARDVRQGGGGEE
jgi:hypothetical protein